MDNFSEALNAVRVKSAVFYHAELTTPPGRGSLEVTPELAQGVGPAADHVVGYHLVTEGEALVQLGDDIRLTVASGDVVIAPHGDAHTISGGPARLICGRFCCELHAYRLFLGGLPRCVRVNLRQHASGRWIEPAIRHLVMDSEATLPGRSALLTRAAEVLLIESLRRYVLGLPPGRHGWFAGARDPIVGAALAQLHRAPADAWTLNTLAGAVGASRSVLVDRFTRYIGDPPLTYLARWRMQLAARLLENKHGTVVQVAAQVGYASESGFCRAFRRTYGVPPARYRRCATLLRAGSLRPGANL